MSCANLAIVTPIIGRVVWVKGWLDAGFDMIQGDACLSIT